MGDDLNNAPDRDSADILSDPLGLNTPDASGGDASDSSEIPQEYMRYKAVVPWEKIPEAARQEVFEGIRKFHGDMSRGTNEAAELRKRIPQLEEKAQFLQQLMERPDIQNVLNGIANPASAPNQNTGLPDLSDYGWDAAATSKLSSLIGQQVKQQLQDFQNNYGKQLQVLQAQVANREVQHQLKTAEDFVKSDPGLGGLPSPNEVMPEMSDLITSGRVRDPQDAYLLAIAKKIPGVVKKAAREELMSELQAKSESLPFSAGLGPLNVPQEKAFTGPNADYDALRSSMSELSSRR